MNTFLNNTSPPKMSQGCLSDYTLLAIHIHGENSRRFLLNVIAGFQHLQRLVVDPIKTFLETDLRQFKDVRRQLEHTQRYHDTLSNKYFSQPRSKEASSLREDAFQMHAARVAYLKASMEFSEMAPVLRAHLDRLLINVFCEQWSNVRHVHSNAHHVLDQNAVELTQIQDWSRAMMRGEKSFAKELASAKGEIEEITETRSRPSARLEDYAAWTAPQVGARVPTATVQPLGMPALSPAAKQGWVYLRTTSAKPVRASWLRRWAFVRNGTFGWLVQGLKGTGVEESEKIGVLLCSVRAAIQEDRRFCFEIKTKDTSIVLQAESQTDLLEWLSAFDVAKQEALRRPASGGATNDKSSIDTAFVVIPAVATELAAKRADGQISYISDEIVGAGLEEPLGQITSRSSLDVSPLRTIGDHEAESTRERIAQKLGLYRESHATVSPATTLFGTTSPYSPTGGIASLISTAYGVLPVGPTKPLPTLKTRVEDDLPISSLAPSTLVTPPSATSLSKTAVLVGMEKGLDLGLVDSLGGTPSGLMANYWGSYNYGYLSPGGNRLATVSYDSPRNGNRPRGHTVDTATKSAQVAERVSESNLTIPETKSNAAVPVTGHLRILSNSLEANTKQRTFSAGFPEFYPAALKAHDAQFRMLFPNVSTEEHVAFVFRAALDLNEQQDLPGTIFVTLENLYFYGNHFGFVLLSNVSLSKVESVSAATTSNHDIIRFHLKHRPNRDDATALLNVKIHLQAVALLRERLAFLIMNANADEPVTLREVITKLTEMESKNNRYQLSTPTAEGSEDQTTTFVGEIPKNSHRLELSAAYASGAVTTVRGSTLRFRLPAHPVAYAPPGFTNKAIEKIFDVSAKALFHILFGDKSAMSQMLYRERRSQTVKQYPWTKLDKGQFVRDFEFSAEAVDGMYRTTTVVCRDSQSIDIANDHLCYVLSDTKTPWHLPFANDYRLISKFVITHAAKSQCKLTIYTRIDWSRSPRIFKSLVESRAVQDLNKDARNLVALVTDQVQKLGSNRHTKRAIAIFGHVGYSADLASIVSATPDEPLTISSSRLKPINLFTLCFDALIMASLKFTSSLLSLMQNFLKHIHTHSVLITILLASLMVHLVATYNGVITWRQERSVDAFMHLFGAHPPGVMARTIYLGELDNATLLGSALLATSQSKWCVR